MKRTITVKGKSEGSNVKDVSIKVDIHFQYLTAGEVKSKVENLKDRLHSFLMMTGDFHQSEIKIS